MQDDYAFRVPPFPYQREEWERSREEVARAILWEQGTGKSKVTIDTACWLWQRQLIDGVVVVAPNGVHRNWVEEEIPTHVPDGIMENVRAMFYQSDKAESKWHKHAVHEVTHHKGFAWLTISYEAFMTVKGKRALIEFFDRRKLLYVIDEGHNIKNPDAARTKSILRSAKYAPFRRDLTGTPIAQGPFDIYPQVEFLDDQYWVRNGFSTFVEFKSHFGIFTKVWNPTAWNPLSKKRDGNNVDVLVGYRRLDELNELLKPISSRLTKEEAGLNLPPKHYRKEEFAMTEAQAEVYRSMRDDFLVWIDTGKAAEEVEAEGALFKPVCLSCGGKREVEQDGYIYQCPECADVATDPGDIVVAAPLVMTRLLRLQQISCGYLPTEDEDEPLYRIPGPNRRLDALARIVEDRVKRHKVIVWARFQLDITLILEELKKRGIKAVRYDGLTNDDERAEAKALFKGERPIIERGQVVGRLAIPREEQADVFVGNPAAGATGLTINIAKTTVYYSNSFKLIDRLQSEDRNHRIGQDGAFIEDLGRTGVEYIDLIAEGTVDEKIVTALRNKFSIASQILGDKFREWL